MISNEGKRRAAASVLMMFVSVAFQPAAWADADDRIEMLEVDIVDVGGELQRLEAKYINPALLEQSYEIETRINDGRVFYLLKDFGRASIIFLDLVSNEKIRGTPAQRDVLFYLADSLFLQGNSIGARRHFNELLAVGAGEYYQDAVKRLIEIASVTDEFDNVDSLYKAARSRSRGKKVRPELVYVYGKSLFFRDKFSQALSVFRQIPVESEVYLQSLYFQGVVLAKTGADKNDKGKLGRAIKAFTKLIEKAGPRPADPRVIEIVELTHMSLGRVYYELGEFEMAVDQYQYVDRVSSNFDRALYEVTWTFIRRGDLKKALRHLDILLLTAPDSSLAPEARLLRGDLMVRSDSFGEAVATYQQVIDDYEPIRDKLGSILDRDGGTKAYFDALVGRTVGRARSVEVPKIVAAWVEDDPKMFRTLNIAKDLDGSRSEIDESVEIIRELEDAINSRSRVDIFPQLKEGWGRGLEVQNRFIVIKRVLLSLEGAMVVRSASADEKARYKKARSERARLERVFDKIPKSRTDLAARERAVKGEYNALETRLYKLGIELDSMRAQLVAMDKWMQDMKARGEGAKPGEEETIRKTMRDYASLIESLEEERDKVRRVVRRSKAQTGINDDVAEQEEVVKKEYQAALANERALLRSLRGRLSGSDGESASKIDGLHNKLLRSEARLETYFGKLNRIVNRKVQEIRREIDVEKVRVAQYSEELTVYSGDSESLAGDIALNNFRRVDERFNELILKADVGIIDVAWKRKEERSTRIKKLFDHRSNDLKTLDRNFEGVLAGEEE
jgi:tetratricopeptide (TPR) repeat protein